MASRKPFGGRRSYIYPTPETTTSNDQNLFEFDESDVWNAHDLSNNPTNPKYSYSSKKNTKTSSSDDDRGFKKASSSSLPVNIPNWSKSLEEEYSGGPERRESYGDYSSGCDSSYCEFSGDVPPHEYLAARRGASFSVLEGAGRTLKGRDLSSVRNDVLKKTGFLD